MISFVDPRSGQPLERRGDAFVMTGSDTVVAIVRDGIPRFVDPDDNYAESFGWQWKKWAHLRSLSRGGRYDIRRVVLERSHFAQYDLRGKSILECGMGGGDETEVLLEQTFSEVHAFDLSTAVERAATYLKDERLQISQASIFEIPYPDRVFDFVYCHRVIQHTPDPEAALRAVCRKVAPGGVLFAHSYLRSPLQMLSWKYKYRWLTKRLKWETIWTALDRHGAALQRLARAANRNRVTWFLFYNLVPYNYLPANHLPELDDEQRLELEKLVTFDALTPWHDHPMTARRFRSIIESEGFRIDHFHASRVSPVYCTATLVNSVT